MALEWPDASYGGNGPIIGGPASSGSDKPAFEPLRPIPGITPTKTDGNATERPPFEGSTGPLATVMQEVSASTGPNSEATTVAVESKTDAKQESQSQDTTASTEKPKRYPLKELVEGKSIDDIMAVMTELEHAAKTDPKDPRGEKMTSVGSLSVVYSAAEIGLKAIGKSDLAAQVGMLRRQYVMRCDTNEAASKAEKFVKDFSEMIAIAQNSTSQIQNAISDANEIVGNMRETMRLHSEAMTRSLNR